MAMSLLMPCATETLHDAGIWAPMTTPDSLGKTFLRASDMKGRISIYSRGQSAFRRGLPRMVNAYGFPPWFNYVKLVVRKLFKAKIKNYEFGYDQQPHKHSKIHKTGDNYLIQLEYIKKHSRRGLLHLQHLH